MHLVSIGLPKKTQTYIFFQIGSDVAAFRAALGHLIPLITTAVQVQDDLSKIAENKKTSASKGTSPPLLQLSGVNIAFSHTGLIAVSTPS